MFFTVNTELLIMLMTSIARDADALGSIKVEVEVGSVLFVCVDALCTSHLYPQPPIYGDGQNSFS